jgi:hypothetical protein
MIREGRKGGMDFREATDKLCAKLDHPDFARAYRPWE